MSLLRTRAIDVGSLLAFTDDPTAMSGVSLMWGDPNHLSLSRHDVVQVLDVDRRQDTPWAKVLVLVVKGKRAGRTGYISIDFGTRTQRCWQALTTTGSMKPFREPAKKTPTSPEAFRPQTDFPVSETRCLDELDEVWFKRA